VSTEPDEFGNGERTQPVDISLSLGEDGELWVARDEDTGVTSQGMTRQAALSNLDEAVAGYHGAGEPPTEADLRELGVDPDRNVSGSAENSEVFE
jgi:predicted RNase H-like HicB family nuclease